MVILLPTPRTSGIQREMSSSRESTPSRARSTIAAAVNCLATEPLSESVPSVHGVPASRFAMPYARRRSGRPARSTPTAHPGDAVLLHGANTESTRATSAESAVWAARGAATTPSRRAVSPVLIDPILPPFRPSVFPSFRLSVLPSLRLRVRQQRHPHVPLAVQVRPRRRPDHLRREPRQLRLEREAARRILPLPPGPPHEREPPPGLPQVRFPAPDLLLLHLGELLRPGAEPRDGIDLGPHRRHQRVRPLRRGAEGNGDVVLLPGNPRDPRAHVYAVGPAQLLAQLVPEPDLEDLPHHFKREPLLPGGVRRPGEHQRRLALALDPLPHRALDHALGRPDPRVAGLVGRAAGGKVAEVALHQRPDRVGIEAPHQEEGEARGVGKPLPEELQPGRSEERRVGKEC